MHDTRSFIQDGHCGEGGLDSSFGWHDLCYAMTTPDEHYHITLSKHPKYSCTSFLRMLNTSIGGRQPYVAGNHKYILCLLVLHADEKADDFIHT